MPSLADLTAFLSTLELNPSLARIKTVEVDLRGWLNPTFWLNKTFFGESRWLGFRDFYHYYLRENEARLREQFRGIAWEDLCKGLEARLYRTQFGMLTEYHAYYLCKDFFGEENVVRHADLDRIGVDFQLLLNGETYNIHIFVDTPRAWDYRKFKAQHKAGNAVRGRHINLPYSLEANRFNSLQFLPNHFGIYTTGYLEYLKGEILAGRIGNDNIVGTRAEGFVYR